MRTFQVVGYDHFGEPIMGEELEGGSVLGRAGHQHRMARLPPRAEWRQGQMAPGVQMPDEGLVQLPLGALSGSPAGTFTSTVTSITFQGQLQKPFRAERVLTKVVRTGATSTASILSQIFVGTDLQGAEITPFDIELVGTGGFFGTRLTMKQAEPGVLIRILSTLSTPLTAPDTIFANIIVLGRIVH